VNLYRDGAQEEGSHQGVTARTTFPVFCSVSTYLDSAPLQRACAPQATQRGTRPVGDRGGFLERHAVRHVRHRPALAHAGVLGVRTALDAEDAVADLELLCGRADRHDLPG